MSTALALDIGGTKIEAGRVDATGRILGRRRVATPAGADADALWATVCDALAPFVGDALTGDDAPSHGDAVLGVGCGGPMTAGGETVSPLNIPGWRGFPLLARLVAHTGLATAIDNDAKALALAEGWIGAARGERNYCGMVVSTGVGAGLVVDGRLLDGASGNAGHLGHVVVEPDGSQPPREIRGSLEAEISGTSIEFRTGRAAALADAEEIRRAGTLLGRAVGGAANLLDLRLCVVAGSVALGFGEPFFAAAQAEVDRVCALEFSRGMRVVPAALGHDGPLVGAAAVGFRSLGRAIGAIDPPRP